MANVRDTSTLKVLMQSVIAQLEKLGIVWWIYDGYSIRRMHQTELLMEVTTDGRGSEDHLEELESGAGAPAEVEAGDDGGEPRGRPSRDFVPLGQPKALPKATTAIEEGLRRKALDRPRRLPSRRRRKQR